MGAVPIAESESTCYSGGHTEVPKILAPPPQTRRDSERHSGGGRRAAGAFGRGVP